MAIVVALLSFYQIAADAGLSTSLLHFQKLTETQLSSTFWISLILSVLLAGTLIAGSPVIASFFDEPLLVPLLWWASILLIVDSFGRQIRIVAEKGLLFSVLARIELVAAGTSLCASVLVAISGGGAYALVAGLLTNSITSTALLWMFASQGWRPIRTINLATVIDLIRYGAFAMLYQLSNALNSQADILVGSRFMASGPMGLYAVCKDINIRLSMVFNHAVSRVALPVLATIQNEPTRVRSIYLSIIRATASINFPIYLFLVAYAPELVEVLLGEQWSDAVPVLQLLALWGLLRSTSNPSGSLLLALGRAGLAVNWSIAVLAVRVPALLIGSQFGSTGIAISLLTVQIGLLVPMWLFLIRPTCGATAAIYFAQMAIPFALSAGSVGVGYLISQPIEHSLCRVSSGILGTGATYLVLNFYFNREWFLTARDMVTRRTN